MSAAMSEPEFGDWRAACPRCGRLIAWKDCGTIVDVLTEPGCDIPRDVGNCSKCGLVEFVARPLRILRTVGVGQDPKEPGE